MSREDPAGIHFHSFWADRARDLDLPVWMRIVGLAYSSHRKNGHATFFMCGQSTLAEQLGTTKKGAALSRLHLQKEIRKAIRLGFLARESNVNCLVLPDEICGGADGHAFAECKHHPRNQIS